MAMRSIIAALCCIITTSAFAADSWNCTFAALDGPPGISSHATIQRNGDKLDWVLDPFVAPGFKQQVPSARFHFHVLEDNKIGLVAVSSEAQVDKDVGVLVSSETIALNKANGAFNMGAVGTVGVYEHVKGICRLK